MEAFGLCYGIWVSEFSESAGRDQDCYNETKGKPE